MQYGLRILVLAASSLALSACGVPPPLRTAPLPQAPAGGEGSLLAGESGNFPADNWWTQWHDPALDGLIAEALGNAPDMAIAAARVQAADALQVQAGGALLPQLSTEAAIGGAKQSENLGIPAAFVPKGVIETGKLSASLGLNLDLWGRARAQIAAARGEAQAARADLAQARLMLASGLALAWGDLARVMANRQIAAASLDADRQIEVLTAQRLRQGLDNQADLALATARRAGSERNLAALDEASSLIRNRIAALLGAGPARAETLPAPSPDLGQSLRLPDQLAASLVARRPDLVAARLRAEAAAQQVRAARAAFFPDINLAAVVGLQSLGLDQLLSNGSSFANFGPAISLPIFSAGQLGARHSAARASYDEAVARYNGALIGAFRDVADAMAQKRSQRDQLAAARAGAAAARQAADMARLRYRAGLANLLQVLAAEDSARAAELARAELEIRNFQIDVMLVKALGGGYAAPAPATETP